MLYNKLRRHLFRSLLLLASTQPEVKQLEITVYMQILILPYTTISTLAELFLKKMIKGTLSLRKKYKKFLFL
jgi:hypothetical protein